MPIASKVESANKDGVVRTAGITQIYSIASIRNSTCNNALHSFGAGNLARMSSDAMGRTDDKRSFDTRSTSLRFRSLTFIEIIILSYRRAADQKISFIRL